MIKDWLEPKFQLIAQPPPPVSDSDAGDTAQREGMFMFGAFCLFHMDKMDHKEFFFIQDRYAKSLDLLNDPKHPGLIRRYPDPAYWGGQSDRLSRDQCVPNIAAMAYLPRKAKVNPDIHLWKFLLAHLRYGGLLFTTNTRKNWAWPPGDPRYDATKYKWKLPDLTFGSFHALYIRSFGAWPLYPMLLILDLDLLGSAIVKCFIKDPTNNDDVNHLMVQYQSELTMPTPWSKLAKYLYGKFRMYPANSGDAKNVGQAVMNAYFRGSNPGPKLEEVYREINSFFFKDRT
jgi:hypothetical protein